ncbi:MAG: hypothetical protein JO287_21840 [Pseudonocardiales bacterium]|nr:hypothetical protein [Pseudonocardiales bacterium]
MSAEKIHRAEPTGEQLREGIQLLRGELAQPSGHLARLDTRTETHGHALDDIEAYVTQTAQLARAAAVTSCPITVAVSGKKPSEATNERIGTARSSRTCPQPLYPRSFGAFS